MVVTIRQATCEDLDLIPVWASNVQAAQFTSRLYPRVFPVEELQLPQESGLAWFAILIDGEPRGHVWLERDPSQSDSAVLGILIGDSRLFGRGIGQRAIPLALEAASRCFGFSRVKLRVRKSNPRAIACYARCGFRIVDEGVKKPADAPPIEYLVMERALAHTP
jgi:RimJ/RimL family protein N-acetyltransferase